jgi:membrane-associated phospholipid phosphatase
MPQTRASHLSYNQSMHAGRLVVAVLLAIPSAAAAQETRVDVIAPQQVEYAPAPAGVDATHAAQPVPEPGGARGFLRDVGGDYKHFFSWSTAKWLGVGGLASLAIHPADEAIREATQSGQVPVLSGGQTYGDLTLEVPLAVGWWIVGHAAHNSRAAEAGRDLVRAQISAVSWTYVAKYSVSRTRPNGDPRSFPSGHASTTFATAMVLQEHYGWKLGMPFFALATYTAASRIVDNKHWASDVVFGAFLGMTSGRTVTMHLRNARATVAAVAVAGGGGVTVSVRMME